MLLETHPERLPVVTAHSQRMQYRRISLPWLSRQWFVAGLMAPISFRHAITATQATASGGDQQALVLALVSAGALRAVSGIAGGLQSLVFMPVAQVRQHTNQPAHDLSLAMRSSSLRASRAKLSHVPNARLRHLQEAGRTLACRVLAHVLQLGPAFHATRSVGALARIVDRGALLRPALQDATKHRCFEYMINGRAGTKATTAVFNAAVFGLLPLLAELPLVCTAISTVSRPAIGGLVATVSLLYIAFTISMTEVPSRAGMPLPDHL